MPAANSDLPQVQIDALEELAEIITPATPGFPSCADADPDGEVLALALREFVRDIPRITRYLSQVAQLTAPERSDLSALEALDPDGFGIVCDLLVGRYLTCRPVWKLLGYPGRVPAQPAPDEAEFFLRDDLLLPVVERGPIYTVPPA
ncbi:hypothetical protein ACJ5H2_22765 (plasmid) [Nocardioides sp. R1-1]|uniref:hypothetical protein n=1 Tax=Nocardioides sp. R1-1 TaxID=3383502 RepID=UPI0038D1A234